METNITLELRLYEDRKRKKQPWIPHWQLCAEYGQSNKADFTTTQTPGAMLNSDLFDNTAGQCLRTMASSVLGALWPRGARSMRLRPAKNLPSTPQVKKFFDDAHETQVNAMDDWNAGLDTALDEYMRDEGGFGTAAVGAFDGVGDSDFLFCPWGVKQMTIAPGANRYVSTVYFEDPDKTVGELVAEYGKDAVSQKVLDLYNGQKLDDKVTLLIVVRPRDEIVPGKYGAWNMPYKSLHIEVATKTLLKESGYEEMPVFVGRMMKNISEDYGRSPMMDALPDVLELNAIREAEIIATEKILDPPLAVLDDGKLGGSTVDTSAGALNVFTVTGRMGSQQPIFPLFTVGDLKPIKDRIEELKQSIASHFYIDRLLDLNNETPMTLGEAQLRDKLRGMTLGSLFKRQIMEVFNPLIRRCFNMLLRKGKFGYMPNSTEAVIAEIEGRKVKIIPQEVADAILAGEDVFEIEYLTPAQRMIEAETAQGIIQAWKFANEVIASRPDAADYLDEDESIKIITPLLGAPSSLIRDDKTVEKIRAVRAAAQKEERDFQKSLMQAETAAKVAKAMPPATSPMLPTPVGSAAGV